MTPSCLGEAPPFGTTGDSKFNRARTLLGNPCVAIPFGKSTNGVPLGMQIVGPIGSDMTLLRWAEWLQRLVGTSGSEAAVIVDKGQTTRYCAGLSNRSQSKTNKSSAK